MGWLSVFMSQPIHRVLAGTPERQACVYLNEKAKNSPSSCGYSSTESESGQDDYEYPIEVDAVSGGRDLSIGKQLRRTYPEAIGQGYVGNKKQLSAEDADTTASPQKEGEKYFVHTVKAIRQALEEEDLGRFYSRASQKNSGINYLRNWMGQPQSSEGEDERRRKRHRRRRTYLASHILNQMTDLKIVQTRTQGKQLLDLLVENCYVTPVNLCSSSPGASVYRFEDEERVSRRSRPDVKPKLIHSSSAPEMNERSSTGSRRITRNDARNGSVYDNRDKANSPTSIVNLQHFVNMWDVEEQDEEREMKRKDVCMNCDTTFLISRSLDKRFCSIDCRTNCEVISEALRTQKRRKELFSSKLAEIEETRRRKHERLERSKMEAEDEESKRLNQ